MGGLINHVLYYSAGHLDETDRPNASFFPLQLNTQCLFYSLSNQIFPFAIALERLNLLIIAK